jgi:hypothetical protein
MGHNHACPTLSLPVPDRANGSGARVCGPQALWPKALSPKAVWPKRPSRPRAAIVKPLLFDRGDTDVTRLPAHDCRNGQPHATTPGPECRTPQADAIVAATPIPTLGLVRGWRCVGGFLAGRQVGYCPAQGRKKGPRRARSGAPDRGARRSGIVEVSRSSSMPRSPSVTARTGNKKAALRRLVVWGLRPPVHAVGVISPGRAVSGNSIPITGNARPGYGQRQCTGSPAELPCRRALR